LNNGPKKREHYKPSLYIPRATYATARRGVASGVYTFRIDYNEDNAGIGLIWRRGERLEAAVGLEGYVGRREGGSGFASVVVRF